jgi:hypothetical protein
MNPRFLMLVRLACGCWRTPLTRAIAPGRHLRGIGAAAHAVGAAAHAVGERGVPASASPPPHRRSMASSSKSTGSASANSKEAFVCTSCGMDHSKVGAGWVLVMITVYSTHTQGVGVFAARRRRCNGREASRADHFDGFFFGCSAAGAGCTAARTP